MQVVPSSLISTTTRTRIFHVERKLVPPNKKEKEKENKNKKK